MDEFTEQISAYLSHMPMWPLALMGLIVVGIGINELVDRRRRISAAEYLRDTILESLAGLYPDPVNWPQDIEAHLYARLPAMKKAFVHFRQHVPQDQLKDYNKDWESYCRFFYSEVSDEQISATEVVSGNDQDSKKSFHTLVSNLLRHIP
jgi:hypothetical protein